MERQRVSQGEREREREVGWTEKSSLPSLTPVTFHSTED